MKLLERGWFKFIMALAFVGLLALASEMSYQDEIAEREVYCDMVKEGKWPDYKDIAERECEG